MRHKSDDNYAVLEDVRFRVPTFSSPPPRLPPFITVDFLSGSPTIRAGARPADRLTGIRRYPLVASSSDGDGPFDFSVVLQMRKVNGSPRLLGKRNVGPVLDEFG